MCLIVVIISCRLSIVVRRKSCYRMCRILINNLTTQSLALWYFCLLFSYYVKLALNSIRSFITGYFAWRQIYASNTFAFLSSFTVRAIQTLNSIQFHSAGIVWLMIHFNGSSLSMIWLLIIESLITFLRNFYFIYKFFCVVSLRPPIYIFLIRSFLRDKDKKAKELEFF